MENDKFLFMKFNMSIDNYDDTIKYAFYTSDYMSTDITYKMEDNYIALENDMKNIKNIVDNITFNICHIANDSHAKSKFS